MKKIHSIKSDDNTGAIATDKGDNHSLPDYAYFEKRMKEKRYRRIRSKRFDGGWCEIWERKPRSS